MLYHLSVFSDIRACIESNKLGARGSEIRAQGVRN